MREYVTLGGVKLIVPCLSPLNDSLPLKKRIAIEKKELKKAVPQGDSVVALMPLLVVESFYVRLRGTHDLRISRPYDVDRVDKFTAAYARSKAGMKRLAFSMGYCLKAAKSLMWYDRPLSPVHVEAFAFKKAKASLRSDPVCMPALLPRKVLRNLRKHVLVKRGWEAIVKVKVISKDWDRKRLADFFRLAGHSVGIGEWSPRVNGGFGMFKCVSVREA